MHARDGLRSMRFLAERKRRFAQRAFHSVRRDVRKTLTVHTRRGLVRAALDIGLGQGVFAVDLVVPNMEAITGFWLRLSTAPTNSCRSV
jgi:hypothetical protein